MRLVARRYATDIRSGTVWGAGLRETSTMARYRSEAHVTPELVGNGLPLGSLPPAT